MPTYSVEGKLGTGKTKFCVWRAQEALQHGIKVASNVDIKPEILFPYAPRSYMRLPDKPTDFDLDALGHGNPDTYEEDRNGVLILDELGTWLNSRNFQDKSRAGLLDWLIHARKKGWTVYLIVQDANMIDRQVRDALIEYQVRCMRMDKVRIPVIGRITGLLRDKWGYLPKFHLATARVGFASGQIVAERWTFRGLGLHEAYDTRQIFRNDYPHGTHSVLPPWDWKPEMLPLERLKVWARGKLQGQPRKPPTGPKRPIVDLIQRLPPDQRLEWLRRCQRAGLIA